MAADETPVPTAFPTEPPPAVAMRQLTTGALVLPGDQRVRQARSCGYVSDRPAGRR